MSFDEEQQRRTRVVVETPTSRREVVQQQVTRIPEKKGISTGVVAAVALTAVALTALLFLFLSNRGDATNSNANLAVQPTPALAATPLPTPFVQPTFQELPPMSTGVPPIVVPSGPAVIEIPTTTTTTDPLASATPAPTPDDGALQSQIRNRIIADKELAAADVTVNVTNGTATLTGTVKSADSRRRASKLATVKGVRTVDNQLTVAAPAPTAAPPASVPPPTAPAAPADPDDEP